VPLATGIYVAGLRVAFHPFILVHMAQFKRVFLVFISACNMACCKTEEIPAYTRKLYSSKANERNSAALGLAKCRSPEVDQAVPRLIEMIYDENVGVQSSAAYALRKINSPAARKALDRATARRAAAR
jgi:hypothetical protein